MDVKDQLEAINGISILSEEETINIRKGAWSLQEDSILINYIAIHGEGHWNYLARNSGLKRTGKSCRLRWKNYLHPNVRRGNFTPEEQLRIMELHCYYGNRWSKIAECLPGRTDNEIKNFWRTRVQKLAKQLRYDINSIEFSDFIRNTWIPRLSEQIQASEYSDTTYHHFDDMIVNNFDGLDPSKEKFDGLEATGPGPIQLDYWATLSASNLSSSKPVEAYPVSAILDNFSKNDCWFSGLDYGPEYFPSPCASYGPMVSRELIVQFAGSTPTTQELSDLHPRDGYFSFRA